MVTDRSLFCLLFSSNHTACLTQGSNLLLGEICTHIPEICQMDAELRMKRSPDMFVGIFALRLFMGGSGGGGSALSLL